MKNEKSEKKVWYKRWWAITIFIFLGIGFLNAVINGGSNGSSSSTQTNNANSQPIPQQKQEQIFKLGDKIQAGDFTWTITNVSVTSRIGQEYMGTFMGAKANGVFLIFDVQVENTGKSAKYLMDSYVKLIDEQGREFSPDSGAAIYLGDNQAMMFDQLNPGIVKKGKIVYDVPQTLKLANIRISSNLLSSSFYNVKLTI